MYLLWVGNCHSLCSDIPASLLLLIFTSVTDGLWYLCICLLFPVNNLDCSHLLPLIHLLPFSLKPTRIRLLPQHYNVWPALPMTSTQFPASSSHPISSLDRSDHFLLFQTIFALPPEHDFLLVLLLVLIGLFFSVMFYHFPFFWFPDARVPQAQSLELFSFLSILTPLVNSSNFMNVNSTC